MSPSIHEPECNSSCFSAFTVPFILPPTTTWSATTLPLMTPFFPTVSNPLTCTSPSTVPSTRSPPSTFSEPLHIPPLQIFFFAFPYLHKLLVSLISQNFHLFISPFCISQNPSTSMVLHNWNTCQIVNIWGVGKSGGGRFYCNFH